MPPFFFNKKEFRIQILLLYENASEGSAEFNVTSRRMELKFRRLNLNERKLKTEKELILDKKLGMHSPKN